MAAVTNNDQLGGFQVTEIDCHCAGGQGSEISVGRFVLPGGREEEFVLCPPPSFGISSLAYERSTQAPPPSSQVPSLEFLLVPSCLLWTRLWI